MSIYVVKTKPVDSEKGPVVHVAYASSEGAAKAARRMFMDDFGVKMADVAIETAPIATGKAGIIEYLNMYHAQLPAGYEPGPKKGGAKKKK